MLENKIALWKTQEQCQLYSIPLIGVLPIEEINTVSDIQATPLPLPPCITDDGDTHQTPPSDSDSMQQFPPVPVKKAHHIT